MRYTVTYENNRGESLVLTEHPYYLSVEDLMSYSWSYTQKEYRRGNKVAGFAKDIGTFSITLHVLGETEEDRNKATDAFNNLIEKDIYDGELGKLYFKDDTLGADEKGWFTYCYIIASDTTKWSAGVPAIKKKLTVVRERESWYHITKKESYTEQDIDPEVQTQTGVKDYEEGYDYAFDYMRDTKSVTDIVNPSVLGSDFIVVIHGAADRPEIRIGDTVIHVDIEVPDGAYLTVDSTKKTITLTLADGAVINAFGARDSAYNIFQRIGTGRQTISWNGAFRWGVQLIEERSEPRWHMQ